MESNVRTLASNLGRFFRPSEAYFVPMKHPRLALRAPLVRFMGTKNASSVRKNPLVYGLGTKLPLHFTLYTLQFLHQLLASSAVFLSESKLCATDGDENHV